MKNAASGFEFNGRNVEPGYRALPFLIGPFGPQTSLWGIAALPLAFGASLEGFDVLWYCGTE